MIRIWQFNRKLGRPVLIEVTQKQAELFLRANHIKNGGIYFAEHEFNHYFREVEQPKPEPQVSEPKTEAHKVEVNIAAADALMETMGFKREADTSETEPEPEKPKRTRAPRKPKA
jgi:hypothetical protein